MTRLRHLSAESARILRAVIAAIRPRGHGFDLPIEDDVLAEIDRTIPFLPRPLQLGFPLGLRLFEWAPLAFTRRPARMSRMPGDDARRYFESWLRSRIAPCRTLALGLRTLVYLAFYQHPKVLAVMEVGWDRRIAETVRLRAETLEHARYGYPR